MKTYIVGTHNKCPIEALLRSTTTYAVMEMQVKYQYFSDEKNASFGGMLYGVPLLFHFSVICDCFSTKVWLWQNTDLTLAMLNKLRCHTHF